MSRENIDLKVVEGFGDEWTEFDQSDLPPEELLHHFGNYFRIFPFEDLPADSEGFDLGCGSGRWAALVAPRVGRLHCIDPSDKALDVARTTLAGSPNVDFTCADAGAIPLADYSQDFGYSLGVLHHIPDTQMAMAQCVRKLRSGAPFLVYLYYRFDNRPMWFQMVWRMSDLGRRFISALPFGIRKMVTKVIAAAIYYPLARFALLLERAGRNVSNFPLSYYRDASFYTMATDSLDRFGTRLEHRYTRSEIEVMMRACGLDNIKFSDGAPFWVACGRKRST